MALLFTEGFEQYNTSADLVYGRYMTASSMPGRWWYLISPGQVVVDPAGYKTVQPAGVSKGLRFNVMASVNAAAGVYLPATTTFIMGTAVYVSTFPGWSIRLGSPSTPNYGASNNYLTLSVNGSGQVILSNARTAANLVVSASNVFMPNVWYYIEFKVTFGSSASAEVYLDGLSIGSATAVDTRPHTSDSAYNQVMLGYPNVSTNIQTLYLDDIYICDGTGSTHNNFLGPVSIYTLFPTANGSTNQFTPTGVASNWDAVNEQIADTATYVSSSTANQIDRYNVTDLAVTPTTVHAVAVGSLATKTESSARQYRNTVTVGGTTSNGTTAVPILSGYLCNQDVFPTAPGGSAWTLSDVNSMEIGVEVL